MSGDGMIVVQSSTSAIFGVTTTHIGQELVSVGLPGTRLGALVLVSYGYDGSL